MSESVYEELCTYVREAADADAALVIIFNGSRGNGMAIQANDRQIAAVPDVLIAIAERVRAKVDKFNH